MVNVNSTNRGKWNLKYSGIEPTVGVEQGFCLVKPDSAGEDSSIGPIIGRVEALSKQGVRITGIRMLHPTLAMAQEHYKHHKGKEFFDEITQNLASGPVVAIRTEGVNAVFLSRKIAGATNPADCKPGDIRYDFGKNLVQNAFHASATVAEAIDEINMWFNVFGIDPRFLFEPKI